MQNTVNLAIQEMFRGPKSYNMSLRIDFKKMLPTNKIIACGLQHEFAISMKLKLFTLCHDMRLPTEDRFQINARVYGVLENFNF